MKIRVARFREEVLDRESTTANAVEVKPQQTNSHTSQNTNVRS
jgi:hypothetical protein